MGDATTETGLGDLIEASLKTGKRVVWLIDYDAPGRPIQLALLKGRFPSYALQDEMSSLVLVENGATLSAMSCRAAYFLRGLMAEVVIAPESLCAADGLSVLARMLLVEGVEAYIMKDTSFRVQKLLSRA